MARRKNHARRTVLKAVAGGLAGTTATVISAAQDAGAAGADVPENVKYAELLPHEFRARLAHKPLAYLPLGTLEWHGEHMPYGADAIQCEALMVECARRYGGIVLPPIHVGPGPTRLMDDGRLLIDRKSVV